MISLRSLLALCLLLGPLLPAAAEPLLYRVKADDAQAWLFGSVHTLRESDYPLDDRVQRAYAAAEQLVFEIAPAEFTSSSAATTALELARFTDGRRLDDVLDAELHARLARTLEGMAADPAQMDHFEPWFAAVQLMNLNLLHHGFSPRHGIDLHFMQRAQRDGKAVAGLETVREQLGIFDTLPLEKQRSLLAQTIEESANAGEELARLMRAWRDGDVQALARIADEEMGRDPLLRERLLVERNRRWVRQLEEMLAREDEVMLIVGALHLVGEDGLVEMLREAGYEVTKVTSD